MVKGRLGNKASGGSMSDNIVRIGIMGGTFDPIHNGHLFAAESARENFSLNEVIFIPSGNPPHKNGHMIVSAEDRYQMTSIAVLDNAYFSVSRIEIDRAGISYTIDTIKELYSICQNKYKKFELFFITGADSILEILSWKDVFSIMSMCKFIAVTRNGYPLEELNKLAEYACENDTDFKEHILVMEMPLLSISSTDIRRRVRNGLTIKYLLPQAVETYVKKNSLYK